MKRRQEGEDGEGGRRKGAGEGERSKIVKKGGRKKDENFARAKRAPPQEGRRET